MTESTIQITAIEATPGYTLYNGHTYAKKVFLAPNDTPSNWREIPDSEVRRDSNG